ncbi:IPT/TIG domain-containing protein [Arthrobacter sp. TE12232]
MEVPAQDASASLSLSPTKGPPGTIVTVTGTGFPKKNAGTLSAGVNSVAFKVSASGYFTADVVIPPTSQPVLDIQAVSGTVKASAAFTIVATPVTQPSPPASSSAPLRFGVGTPGGPLASAELDQAASLAGEAPSVILSYKDFNQAPPIAELDAVRSRGAVTLLTWEPWAWGGGTEQPAYALGPHNGRKLRSLPAAVGRGLGVLGAPGDAALRARDERQLVPLVGGNQRQRPR